MTEQTDTVERREQQRFPCEPPLMASFACAEGSIIANVEDISPSGAKLRIANAHSRTAILVQGEFDHVFQTAHGPLECRARTAWVQRVRGDLLLGIEFTGLDKNSDDPVRSSLERLCASSPRAM
jgi:hypothetical protein